MERKFNLPLKDTWRIAAAVGAVTAFSHFQSESVEAYPIIDDSNTKFVLADNFSRTVSTRGGERFNISIEKSPLAKYLEDIQPMQNFIDEKIQSQKNIFNGYRGLTKAQELKDFRQYFPIYYSAQQEYKVPWELLWILHVNETNVSTERNPERSGYTGAMQRDPQFYSSNQDPEAFEKWSFLGEIDQRYTKSKGYLTDDYKEILFAAWKINKDANHLINKNPNLPREDAILQAQYSYCASWAADIRINQYLKIKQLLK